MRNNFTVKVNGATVHYNDEGISAVPLVFIHGFPFDKTLWLPQYHFFKTRYRVIIYDIRGFGFSTNDSDTDFSIEVLAKDLLLFLNALKIEKAIVCGLSMGGYVLMNALRLDPDKFSGIIVCDTQCNADSEEAKQKRYRTIEHIRAKGITGFAEEFVKDAFYIDSFNTKKEEIEAVTQVILNTKQQTIISALKAMAERKESCSTLESLKIPTLIICGKQDKLTPPEKAQVMHTLVKNSVFAIINNAGHLSNIDQPEEFNGHVKKFIEGL